MGTHPKSPSKLLDGTTLADHLASNPSLIGDEIVTLFDAGSGNIPFLFKILAIEKALSIQTHPDKPMAERLHAEQPEIYKGIATLLVQILTMSLYDTTEHLTHRLPQIRIINQKWPSRSRPSPRSAASSLFPRSRVTSPPHPNLPPSLPPPRSPLSSPSRPRTHPLARARNPHSATSSTRS